MKTAVVPAAAAKQKSLRKGPDRESDPALFISPSRPTLVFTNPLNIDAHHIGDPIAPEQYQTALTLLDISSAAFLAAIAPLTPRQWTTQPGPARWSPAQIAEHVVLVEIALLRKVRTLVATSPSPQPATESDFGPAVLARLTEALAGRQGRVDAPASLHPSGGWTQPEVRERFQTHRAQLHEFLLTNAQPLHLYTAPSPFFGPLSAYHWLLYAPLHTQRHIKQLDEALLTANE